MLKGGGDLHGSITATKELNTCTSTTKSSISQFAAHTSSPKKNLVQQKNPQNKNWSPQDLVSCWTIQKFQVFLANIDIFV